MENVHHVLNGGVAVILAHPWLPRHTWYLSSCGYIALKKRWCWGSQLGYARWVWGRWRKCFRHSFKCGIIPARLWDFASSFGLAFAMQL